MPADGFNIAVAPLLAAELPQDPALQSDLQRDGEALGRQIAQMLMDQRKELSKEMESQSINILAPSQWPKQYKLKTTTNESLAQAARDLRADIIVYGTLRAVSSRIWQVEPRFYIADRITKGRADEMGGAEGLGKPISYQPGNRSTISETVTALQPRVHLLVRLISGLHYQGRGNEKGFEQSAQIFCAVGDEFPLASVGDIGQDLLHTFCGQSKAQLAWFAEDASLRNEMLSQALHAFDKGLEITPQHLRAQVSRAATLVQLGMPGFDCEDGDLDKLRQAQGIFESRGYSIQELATLPEGLQNGVHLNLGHIYFWLGFCDADLGGQNSLWPIARSHYEAVIELQRQSSVPDSISAATSYSYIGYTFILSDTPDYELAFGQFDRSVTMLQRDGDDQAMKYAIELMPLVLSLQCKTNQRISARQRLDAFVNALPNPQSTRDEILSHISPKTKEACQL
jgi:tetratricopeptide (TPR) repeat protein